MKFFSISIKVLFILFVLNILSCKDINPNVSLDLQLRTALEEKNKPLFKKILKAGADANVIFDDGYWVMGDVIRQRDISFLKLAIEYGGDVNLKNKYIGSQTPIFVAESVGNIEAIEFILDKGADPDIKDCSDCSNGSGETVFQHAVYTGDFEIAYIIFEHKGTLISDEKEVLIKAIEENWAIKTKRDNGFREKFIEYLVSQGYEIDLDKKPECHQDLKCKQEKEYKRKIERCNIVKSNPPENVPSEGIEEFLDKCQKNMPMYIEMSGQ